MKAHWNHTDGRRLHEPIVTPESCSCGITSDMRSSSEKYPMSGRPAVLSPVARAYAKKIASNRKSAIKFLKEAGIIDKPGTLAKPYR